MSSATVQPITTSDMLLIFGQWRQAVSTGDMSAFCVLYAEDAVLFAPMSPDPVRGRDAIWQYESAMHAAFPEAALITRKPVIDQETVAVEWEYSGKNTGPITTPMRIIPPTGQWMKIFGCSFLHFRDGLIAQERRYYDARTLYQQLGLG